MEIKLNRTGRTTEMLKRAISKLSDENPEVIVLVHNYHAIDYSMRIAACLIHKENADTIITYGLDEIRINGNHKLRFVSGEQAERHLCGRIYPVFMDHHCRKTATLFHISNRLKSLTGKGIQD